MGDGSTTRRRSFTPFVCEHVRLGGISTPKCIGLGAVVMSRGEVGPMKTIKVPVVEYPAVAYPYLFAYPYTYAWPWPYGYYFY